MIQFTLADKTGVGIVHRLIPALFSLTTDLFIGPPKRRGVHNVIWRRDIWTDDENETERDEEKADSVHIMSAEEEGDTKRSKTA